jgi:histone deacetylase 1/2
MSFPFGCIIGWCDANWASDVQTQKFISRYAFIFGEGVISLKSQKQQLMTLSSTKVEYIAVVGIKSTWLHQLLDDLGYS